MERLEGSKTYIALGVFAVISAVMALDGVLHFLTPDMAQVLQWLAGVALSAAGIAGRMALAKVASYARPYE